LQHQEPCRLFGPLALVGHLPGDDLGLLLPPVALPGHVGEPAGATPDGRRMTTGFTV
jgi:hypothetical protein